MGFEAPLDIVSGRLVLTIRVPVLVFTGPFITAHVPRLANESPKLVVVGSIPYRGCHNSILEDSDVK